MLTSKTLCKTESCKAGAPAKKIVTFESGYRKSENKYSDKVSEDVMETLRKKIRIRRNSAKRNERNIFNPNRMQVRHTTIKERLKRKTLKDVNTLSTLL